MNNHKKSFSTNVVHDIVNEVTQSYQEFLQKKSPMQIRPKLEVWLDDHKKGPEVEIIQLIVDSAGATKEQTVWFADFIVKTAKERWPNYNITCEVLVGEGPSYEDGSVTDNRVFKILVKNNVNN